jgi:hypothetical protein
MTSVMDSIRGFRKISFREIERASFRIACEMQIEAMKIFLEDLDEEIYKNRDKERYESVDRKDRTIETILGIPVTFERRYYKDRKADNYTFLLDEALGLPERSRQSPLAREIAVRMAVDGPSYRIASESLERIFGGRVISHEGIRQNLIRTSDEAKVLLQRERKNKRPKENPGIIFIEVDGLYASLQKQSRRSTEEKVGVIHTGWDPRSECRGEYVLKDIRIARTQSSSPEGFWSTMSETLHSEFEINEDTIIVINGDRAKWIRMFREWFCDCTVLYQVDRFHLLRTLGGIFKRGSESYYRLRDAIDKDPTGARFMAALAEESASLSGKKRLEAEVLLRDLEDIADSVCDYRVRLSAMGYDIKGLRPMGAAEAQMDRFADRIKGRGQSWSPWGLDAMMRLLGMKFEGRLEELLHNLAVKQEPLPGEKKLVKKQASQVAKTLLEQYGDVWSHSMPVMDVGRFRSGGLSKVFHKIAAGW